MEKDKNKMENKKLAELLEHLEYELVQGTLDREIPAVVYDSRKVVPGCLFLCIGGANFDGHDFAAQVAEQGAGVLVVQKDVELPENVNMKEAVKLPLRVVVPSFMTCELQRAFEIGLLLYIPFMLIDIVVSSTLMSMGMIMLPPSMISMPFKLLLFVTVNGWELLFSSLVQSFK